MCRRAHPMCIMFKYADMPIFCWGNMLRIYALSMLREKVIAGAVI